MVKVETPALALQEEEAEVTEQEEVEVKEEIWDNPLVYGLIGALVLLCCIAICLSVACSVRMRKRGSYSVQAINSSQFHEQQ